MIRPTPLVVRRRLSWVAVVVAAGLLRASAAGAGCGCGTLADEFRAAAVGLEREWIVQVPFDSAGHRIERVTVGDGLVVAESGDGGIHAIRCAGSGTLPARAGTVAWSRVVDAAAGHSWPATIGTRLVVVASEQAVHALDRETGTIEWEHPTASLTATSAVQVGQWVYAPLATNRLLRLAVNPLGGPVVNDPPPAAPGQRGPADPIPPESPDPIPIDVGGGFGSAPRSFASGVLWTSDHGLAVLEWTASGWIRHELPESRASGGTGAALALAGPPAVRNAEIYLATAAGALARVDLNVTGKAGLRTAWTALLPAGASASPLVSGDVVVVALGPSGVAGFSAQDGRELWRSELVGTVVATAGGRAWLIDAVGRLTALDLATGRRLRSLCLGDFTIPVVNTISERLVLASPTGLVVSLAPPVTAADRAAPAPAAADPAATPR